MIINKLAKITKKPELYTKGENIMWTDSHISKQLLQIHLNKDIDLASRKKTSILETVKWVLKKAKKDKLNILDLGCGPGLYSEEFAKHGHGITGIDISKESINYAKKSASTNNLKVTYKTGSYLESQLGQNEFDLAIMIYTDFGVLHPGERKLLLDNIKKALKPDGLFIFDVLNVKCLKEATIENSWECSESGFWSNDPYLHLSNSYLYKKEKVILYQHFIVKDGSQLKTYRFWTHFFSHDDLSGILNEHNFTIISFNENVLPESDQWNGENVTFVISAVN